MKKLKYLLLLIGLTLLSCSPTTTSSMDSSNNESTLSDTQSDIPYSSPEENSSSSKGGGIIRPSSEESSSSSNNKSSSSSKTSSSSEQENNDPIPSSGETLPIGNKTVSGPSNTTPVDISDWVEYEFDGYMSEGWSYIMGNNKVKGNFYADGSIKFSHLWYGIQTPLINNWKKIEVRLHISQVNNAGDDGVKDDQPIFHIYGYNNKGKHISTDYLEQGSITKQKEGNYVRFYLRNIDISYFEIRLNANPVKGSQHYNFGINKIDLKGWDYE